MAEEASSVHFIHQQLLFDFEAFESFVSHLQTNPQNFHIKSSATSTQHLSPSATVFSVTGGVRFRRYQALQRREETAMGKFAAEIRDPKSERIEGMAGDIRDCHEAARAYDRAAFEMRGSKAILNFPLEADNCRDLIHQRYLAGKGRETVRLKRQQVEIKVLKQEEYLPESDSTLAAASHVLGVSPLTPSNFRAGWEEREMEGISICHR
ncbi:Ethylene-responsive transcription factor ERF105 [Vitis vinifera]|uniref:Ethylene-responsive transcription factor ERF105 n=1 Tax=Vitis vinifera TaxID=29760 RepID=A0A438CXV5_VITVI|nr:Ethylene-responsive transcription factor ERF105 [Vitis vinifera]